MTFLVILGQVFLLENKKDRFIKSNKICSFRLYPNIIYNVTLKKRNYYCSYSGFSQGACPRICLVNILTYSTPVLIKIILSRHSSSPKWNLLLSFSHFHPHFSLISLFAIHNLEKLSKVFVLVNDQLYIFHFNTN